jgi:hypothetical protein
MKDNYARMEDVAAATAALRPSNLHLQANVREHERYENVRSYWVRLDKVKLLVLLSAECVDGELWAHLSVSAQEPKRIPTWRELTWCKNYFLGEHRKAVQVLPARAEYVNIHPHVLNLYSPLERDPLPDFRVRLEDGTIGV